MIDVHNGIVDIICDKCKTRLCNFIDRSEDFPKTIKQAEETALDHNWSLRKDHCPKCK